VRTRGSARRAGGAARARVRRADGRRSPDLAPGGQGVVARGGVSRARSVRRARRSRGSGRGSRGLVSSHAVAARRVLELTPERFRRVALVVLGMLVLIVATGATVRLTGSGLGCQHWPGCQPGDPFPKKGYHSYIEFSNRIVAAFTVLATLILALSATMTHSLTRPAKVLAWVVFVGTL